MSDTRSRGHTTRLLRFPADPQYVESARRAVSGACAIAGLPEEVCDTTVLLTSETVTNAVVHGRSEVRLAIDAGPHGLRVEVGDDNDRLPTRRTCGPDSIDGRGMALLESLASAWGTQSLPTGKIVWFELQIPSTLS